MDELSGTIEPGYYTLDASVKVDQEGRVVEVETTGQPNPDVGGCMRIALREMRLPKDVFQMGMLRTSASANGQAMPDRAQIGEVVTVVVVVTVVFTEVIIEAFAIAVGVTVTATVAAGAAEALAKRRKPKKEEDEPTCLDHYEACMDDASIADRLGAHWKSSLCNACRVTCEAKKNWPDTVPMSWGMESCKYKGHDKWNK
ncbi:hypothetical protein [Polyangium sp. 15x6]|uniref:hypothetical protein n=1 Tax=Polyangium sp. 15x6 TaxID=3042687 RepID=UPI00249CA798|nr:hypothetical protein [Polyangium sp. 15x6]MDI3286658.1 hypothetical protein [Polyangium sp. 15x6]